jgi:phosphoribosylformylglycinamidine synthase
LEKIVAKAKVGVVRFPGTNCDRDVFEAVGLAGAEAVWLWHADLFDAKAYQALILPGGFSYGDYLRSGALAARAVAMKSVREAASAGVPILGICNGFQILCEAGLLPGALTRNRGLRFVDTWVDLKKVGGKTVFGRGVANGDGLRIPIAHADGRFVISDDALKSARDRDQVWLEYKENPNGSISDIAGITNEAGNVAALMPHPERAFHEWMGGVDGRKLLEIWS